MWTLPNLGAYMYTVQIVKGNMYKITYLQNNSSKRAKLLD